MKVRICFSKFGNMRYIGHLDTMRYFQKAIRRAELPVHYTTGFSAHQIMSFAFPLGVGLIGEREYLDIETDDDITSKEIVERLNPEMAEGFQVIQAVKLPDKAENAMASVKAADYVITRKDEGSFPAALNSDLILAYMNRDYIPFMKVTAKTETEINLKEHIFELSFQDNSLFMRVDASSSGNLKPMLLLAEIFKYAGADFEELDYLVTRKEVYASDENGKFISLLDVGTVIE